MTMLRKAALSDIAIVLVCASAASAAPAVKPPESLLRALGEKGCSSVKWTALPAGDQAADCITVTTSKLDGREKKHRYYLFKKQADGGFTIQKLFEYIDSSSIRAKNIPISRVKVQGARITLASEDSFGWVHTRTWDVGTNPAALVEEREGGRKICQEGISDYSSEIAEPLCATDFAKSRTNCAWSHPDCRNDASEVKKESYVAIPVLAAGAQEPFKCATQVGAKSDVTFGKNPDGTTFRVVAVDDTKEKRLRLLARAEDKTPFAVTDAAADWQPRDHFELWLSDGRVEAACPDVADLEAFCKAKLEGIQTVQFIIAPLPDGKLRVVQATKKPRMEASEIEAAPDGDRVSITLRGTLYEWAHKGGITLAYSDSQKGKKQDALIATSSLRFNKPETFGRLGDARVCGGKGGDPEAVPVPVR